MMGSFDKLTGEVEADETFIGGKARNMHARQKQRRITGTGVKDKTAVMGILERGGKVRTTVVENRKKHALQAEVHKHVEAGAALYTDALLSYDGLAATYAHQVIDHAVKYVDGKVHTNGLENYWSLLKRGIAGTYVIGRTVPPVPLLGRTGVPLQQPEGHGRLRPLPDGGREDCRQAPDVEAGDRHAGRCSLVELRRSASGRGAGNASGSRLALRVDRLLCLSGRLRRQRTFANSEDRPDCLAEPLKCRRPLVKLRFASSLHRSTACHENSVLSFANNSSIVRHVTPSATHA